jgi:hypothetical protein
METLSPSPSHSGSRHEELLSFDKPVRSNKVWYDDGNLVLQAEEKLFKVHRSILSQRSSVFCDMLAVPQPDKPLEQLVDGCEVVQLGDDRGDDMEEALRAIYGDQKYVCSDLAAIDTFKLTRFAIDLLDTLNPSR